MQKTATQNGFRWTGISPFFHHPFVFNFIPDLKNKVVLDAGCGKGIYGYLIRATRNLRGAKFYGMDLSSHHAAFARRHKIYDKYIVGDITHIPFSDKTIDVLMCIETLPHLPKKDGETFLNEIDRTCKDRAILVFPNIPMQPLPDQYYDSHRSRWRVSDLRHRGYKVYGIGVKLPHPYGKWYATLIYALQYIITPFAYFYPQISGYLIAVKDYDK